MKPGRRSSKRGAAPGRSSSKAVIALAVMGGLVLLYGWNSFFLAPKGREKAAVRKELETAQKKEAELRQNLTQLRKLAGDTKSREAELARLGRLVPADADVAGAIDALNDIAGQAQVAWSSFNPTPPAPPTAGGGPATIGITMKVAGTFNQIFDYLRRVESLDRLVVVDGLNLTGTGGRIEADIRARMFAAGPATSAAGTKTPASGGTANPAGTAALPKAGN